MPKLTIEEQILNVLGTQRFADWFTEDRRGNFDRYIQSDPDTPTRLQILEDIHKLFDTDLLGRLPNY